MGGESGSTRIPPIARVIIGSAIPFGQIEYYFFVVEHDSQDIGVAMVVSPDLRLAAIK